MRTQTVRSYRLSSRRNWKYSLVKAGHDAVQGRQKQVAEALACKAPIGKAVIEQLLHGWLRVGQRHNAVADIAGRQHPDVPPQHTAAAAVVRHGDFRAKRRFSGHKRHRTAILFASDAPFHGVFDKRLNLQRG
mgnify:CR=1 FL=1